MPKLKSSHVEVYVFRRRRSRVEFLTLRRAPGRKLGGVWQPITGKRRRWETAVRAAMRELEEETGLRPKRWWCLETLTTYFDPDTDTFGLLPLFAAEASASDRVRLSREHTAFAFVPAREAARRFLWDSQRRGLEAVRSELLRRGPLARALEITYQSPRRARSRARRSIR